MARSDVIRADIARVEGMTDAAFAAAWGAWCEARDKDPKKVQRRWVQDLKKALPHAEAEESAVATLVAAKDAYRADPSAENKAARDAAVTAVQAARMAERGGRKRLVAGDAYTNADEV